MFLIYDTETTSLLNFKLAADHPEQARIMQLGAILTDDKLNPMAKICRLIRPSNWPEIAKEAIATHGLTFEKCMDEGIPIESVIAEFDAFCDEMEKADGTTVAFNQQFDSKFIRGERRRLGRADRFGLAREFDPMRASVNVCRIPPTPAMVRAKRTNFKTPNLGEAYRFFTGEEMAGAHDALADCEATLRIMVALRDKHAVDIRGVPRESIPGIKESVAPASKPASGRMFDGSAPPKADDLDIF